MTMARFPDGWVFIPKISGPEPKDGKLGITVSVDERELVMCKSCRNYDCKIYGMLSHTDGNWFCADGKRRDDDAG
jgi:hypothetical protein